MRLKKASLKQFFSFFVVGGIATIVDWLTFYLVTHKAGFHYIIGVIISYSFGGATSYILNKIFTFKDKSKDFALQISLFILVMLGAYGINILLMYLQIEILFKEISFVHFFLSKEMTARIITTGIVFIYNYIMHKSITFNKKLLEFVKKILIKGFYCD